MWVFREIQSVFDGNATLCAIVAVAVGALTVGAIIGYITGVAGVYVGTSSLSVGGASLALAVNNIDGKALRIGFACVGISCGIIYLLFLSALGIKRRIQRKKAEYSSAVRSVQYTLPERGNTYVRARLHTALNSYTGGGNDAFAGEETDTEDALKMGHAEALLALVKSANLSVAERLETKEMEKIFALCKRKAKWSQEDVRTMNEMFARLLKICAKYAV